MDLNKIFTFENLYEAHKKCRLAKQHKREVIQFESNLAVNINKIINDIQNKTYNIGKYCRFLIYEPKERLIEALPYKDRVVIRCFCEHSIKPRIEKRLIYDNAACRKNKGTSFGEKRLATFLKREYAKENDNEVYFLKCDISKYFPSIDHGILFKQLKKTGFSKDEMWFIEKLIKEQPNDSGVGLPLGNQSSQWFALLYLNRIDRLIKEELRVKSYIRYMDDMILLSRDKSFLRKCQKRIEEVCATELNLSLNNKTQVGKASIGIDFLGFRHILTTSGKVVKKLRTSARIRLKHHLKVLEKLRKFDIVDDEYVYIRKNAFYNHIKDTKESFDLKQKAKP